MVNVFVEFGVSEVCEVFFDIFQICFRAYFRGFQRVFVRTMSEILGAMDQ